MAFYVKAFSLVVKTASKPLARALKARISEEPTLRAFAIDGARLASRVVAFVMREDSGKAQSENAETTNSSATTSELGAYVTGVRARARKPTFARATYKAPVMSEDQALQAASEFAGEAFVFATAGAVVYWEVDKANAKDEKRRADAAAERAQLCEIIDTQHSTMKDMKALIEDLLRFKRTTTSAMEGLVNEGREVRRRLGDDG